MAFTKTFRDIDRAEFLSIYDNMGSNDFLYLRVGYNSVNSITDSNTGCTQSTDWSALLLYTYQGTWEATKTECGDSLTNSPSDIKRKVENLTLHSITADDTNFALDLIPVPPKPGKPPS